MASQIDTAAERIQRVDREYLAPAANATPKGMLISVWVGLTLTVVLYIAANWLLGFGLDNQLSPEPFGRLVKTTDSDGNAYDITPLNQKPEKQDQIRLRVVELKDNGLSNAPYLLPEANNRVLLGEDKGSKKMAGLGIYVQKGPPDGSNSVLYVEVRSEFQRSIIGGTKQVVLDIAFRDETLDTRWRRIRWWESDRLAPSPQLIRVQGWPWSGNPVLKDLKFDTSESAFLTWMKSHLLNVLKTAPNVNDKSKSLNKQQVNDVVAPAIGQILANHYPNLQQSFSVNLTRILNGFIQFCTFWVFFSAMFIIAAGWRVFIVSERGHADKSDLKRHIVNQVWTLDIVAELQATDDKACAHRERWGVRSATLNIWHGALSMFSGGTRGDAAQYIESLSALEEDQKASRGFNLMYLVGAIPAIGFVGTVYGIGLALMGTGSVLSDQLAKQQSGVSTVALALGVAFDTTLVALLLSLVVLWLVKYLNAEMEKLFHDTRRFCLEVLVFDEDTRLLGAPATPEDQPGSGKPSSANAVSFIQSLRGKPNRSLSLFEQVLRKDIDDASKHTPPGSHSTKPQAAGDDSQKPGGASFASALKGEQKETASKPPVVAGSPDTGASLPEKAPPSLAAGSGTKSPFSSALKPGNEPPPATSDSDSLASSDVPASSSSAPKELPGDTKPQSFSEAIKRKKQE